MDLDALQEDMERMEETYDEEMNRFSEESLHVPISALHRRKTAITIAPDATIRTAIDRMVEAGVGCVSVIENGKFAGILTERDILNRVAPEFRDIDRRCVAEVMTRGAKRIAPDATVAEALRVMHLGRLRHLPLVTEDGEFQGMLSVRNIVEYIVEHFPVEVLNLPPKPLRGAMRAREGA